MLKTFEAIKNIGIFKDFVWKNEVKSNGGAVQNFTDLNILYGRNYSGKTTLSRIIRSVETKNLTDKYLNPEFIIKLGDRTAITQENYSLQNIKVRVFNEDFIKENLRFIINPDDHIESFAILGDNNATLEKEIIQLEEELGSNIERNETGIYLKKKDSHNNYIEADAKYRTAQSNLDKKLNQKATDKELGIKYKPEKYGDQNYTIIKLKHDISQVLSENYTPPSEEEQKTYENLILESIIPSTSIQNPPSFSLSNIIQASKEVIEQEVSESNKLEELVKNSILNRWAKEGVALHKDTDMLCVFCSNEITQDRWSKLENHFDEESQKIENKIDSILNSIAQEKAKHSQINKLDTSKLYSKWHSQANAILKQIGIESEIYIKNLEIIEEQLLARKNDIINTIAFETPTDNSNELNTYWSLYKEIFIESNNFTTSLGKEKNKAKTELRLKEVYDFLTIINYTNEQLSLQNLKQSLEPAVQKYEGYKEKISSTLREISTKKKALNDEAKGAEKVNEYLNNYFGHQSLKLEAIKESNSVDNHKAVRFEVMRDGNKAYHLSEGECSLLAFCYFIARLDDIETKATKPLIWIDDPISSLDGNHIFFIFSIIDSEIVSSGNFDQLFISTHNLEFLKYLKKLNDNKAQEDGTSRKIQKSYFTINRQHDKSTIQVMPKYLKDYVTEFNFLFHQIHKCANIESVDDSNYHVFYNFPNNSRKFFEIYLYYKYPDQGMNDKSLERFFGNEGIPTTLISRINNEYSHLSGVFERGATPIEIPEMQTAAKRILEKLQEDEHQYNALLKSIGAENQ
ncbi:AAA family ATPase [Cobetia sp. QF-1]|uniref:AAA family ATPase n=1 Tax=Cobetia sp. QF-1 TaxID=1969833 RepID=UPI000B541EB3|nr:AAA family ATPase [Cobetia sp. QF-1]